MTCTYHTITSAWPLVSSVPAATAYASLHVARDNMGALLPSGLVSNGARRNYRKKANKSYQFLFELLATAVAGPGLLPCRLSL